jgi:hypothetical protein
VGAVEVVCLDPLPALTHLIPHAVQVKGALLPETVVCVLGRLREEVGQGESKLLRRLERRQAERIREHQPTKPITLGAGEAGRDGAAENLPHQYGWRGAGLLDQLAEPRDHAIGVQGAVGHRRDSVARQVGGNHTMGRRQVRDHPYPLRGMLAWAVQKHHRRTVSALQHDGGNTGQLQPSFRDGHPRQQPFTSALAVWRLAAWLLCLFVGGRLRLGHSLLLECVFGVVPRSTLRQETEASLREYHPIGPGQQSG